LAIKKQTSNSDTSRASAQSASADYGVTGPQRPTLN
jgi:hypothetical protein